MALDGASAGTQRRAARAADVVSTSCRVARSRARGLIAAMRLLEALKAGSPVEVGSADLMIAMMHGGQDYRRFAFGGAAADRVFLLDGDRLLELSAG